MPAPVDLFAQLSGCKWRDVAFPIASVRTQIAHDHAAHANPDQDGEDIESTGRKALRMTLRCLFFNHLTPAGSEAWQQPLYPAQYNAFLTACADHSAGVLVHPEHGQLRAKVVTCDAHLDAGRRDGAECEVTWVEARDDLSDALKLLTSPSSMSVALASARTLDATLSERIKLAHLEQPPQTQSFEQMVNTVAGVFDTATLMSKKYMGMVDRIRYRLDALGASMRSLGLQATDWPTLEAIERMKASLYAIKRDILVATKSIKTYITPFAMSLSMIAQKFGNSIADIIKLNPDYAAAPTVPERSVVRYYGV